MSRFYAEIKGSRGIASRQGGISSGMWSHTRGWTSGVEVVCHLNRDGEDEINIYVTGGSGGNSVTTKLIATIAADAKVIYNGTPCKTNVRQKEDGFTD